MSAFIVSRRHIDALVAVALYGPSGIAPSPSSAWSPTRWFDVEPPEGAGMTWYSEHCREVSADVVGIVGELLTMENVKSVEYRYPNSDVLPATHLEGNTPDWYEVYDTSPADLRRASRPTAVECLKAIDCYEYQACEHPGWSTSEAAIFCNALRRQLLRYVPGYDEAPWEWTDTHVVAK